MPGKVNIYNAAMSRPGTVPAQFLSDKDFIYTGSQAQSVECNFPQMLISSQAIAAPTTNQGMMVAIALQAGQVVNYITYITGTTAAVTPTAQVVALYDSSTTPVLQATSGDLTTTARAANTVQKVKMLVPYTVPTAGIYYVFLSWTAATVPTTAGITLTSSSVPAGSINGGPQLGAAQTGAYGGVAPATMALGAASAKYPWIMVS